MNETKKSKSRVSTATFAGGRGTMMGGNFSSKVQDPRPIYEKKFQDDSFNKLIHFLMKFNFEHEFSKKFLTTPSDKEFKNIFNFLAKKIRPDWDYTLNKLEDDLQPLLLELKYPFTISKNCLKAIGAPHSLPPLMAALAWMVELATYLDIEDTIVEDINSDESAFDKAKKELFYSGYLEYLQKGETTDELNKFKSKIDSIEKEHKEKNQELEKEIKEYTTLYDNLKNDNEYDIKDLSFKNEISLKEYDLEKDNFEKNEKHILNEMKELISKEDELETKQATNKEIVKEIELIENIVNNQKVSYQEFEIMQNTKTITDNQILVLQTKKSELEEKLGALVNSRDRESFQLSEKIKTIKHIIEKISGDKVSILSKLQFEQWLEESNNENADIEKMKSEFQIGDLNIQSLIEDNLGFVWQKEDETLKLQSEILVLNDKKNEAEIRLKSLDHVYEKQCKDIEADKINFQKEVNDKTETSRKNNEMLLNSEKEYELKKVEVQSLKDKDILLENEIKKEEIENNNLFSECQDELDDTINEVMKYKKENLTIIRRGSKNTEKIKDTLINILNSNK